MRFADCAEVHILSVSAVWLSFWRSAAGQLATCIGTCLYFSIPMQEQSQQENAPLPAIPPATIAGACVSLRAVDDTQSISVIALELFVQEQRSSWFLWDNKH